MNESIYGITAIAADSVYFNMIFLLIAFTEMMLNRRFRRSLPVAIILFILSMAISWIIYYNIFDLPPHKSSFLLPVFFFIVTITTESDWGPVGHTFFSSSLAATMSYPALLISNFIQYREISLVTPLSAAFILALIIGSFIVLGNTFHFTDIIFRIRWPRKIEPINHDVHHPMVSIHVPAHNEPPEMVKETLNYLSKLDYPRFEVIMVDDNTEDPAVWQPVKEHCEKLGKNFRFIHLEGRKGFKAGALNEALKITDPKAQLIAIVDSDYQVEPNYLKTLAEYFYDPNLAFIQTPQDYNRFNPKDPFQRGMYIAYQTFYKASERSRNERNSVYFVGTMGIIRKEALQIVGGWDEDIITEDAELAVRLLEKGWKSYYVDVTMGRGIMPLDISGYKRQYFRWSYGGGMIIWKHIAKLNPFNRKSRLNLTQKLEFLYGGGIWWGSFLSILFSILILAGGFLLPFKGKLILPYLKGPVLMMPLLFILLYELRFFWMLPKVMKTSIFDTYKAYMAFTALTFPIAKGCIYSIFYKKLPFNRTPKSLSKKESWLSHVKVEALLFFLFLLVAAINIALPIERTWGFFVLISLSMFYAFAIYGSILVFAWLSSKSGIQVRKA